MRQYTITKVTGTPDWSKIPSLDVDNYQRCEELDIKMKSQICYDEEALELVKNGINPLAFPGLEVAVTPDDSLAINFDNTPKVIISASGMCEAGRIRHHLKHNLWRPECTVVFVGYQAEGSLGRKLLDGAAEVKMFGEEIAVKAQIVNFPGLCSHAGLSGLLNWIQAFSPKPKQVFVVHGDAEVVPQYVERLEKLGFAVHGPELMEEYDRMREAERNGTV